MKGVFALVLATVLLLTGCGVKIYRDCEDYKDQTQDLDYSGPNAPKECKGRPAG